MEAPPVALTLSMLKAEVMETLPHGCVAWTLGKEHFAELRTAHHKFLLRIIGFQRRHCTDHTPRLLRRHNARALRRPSASGVFCCLLYTSPSPRD